jgi:hypothetical protein
VLAGEGTGGALIVAADFALGELVEEPFALVVEGLGGYDLAAQVAEVGEPVAEVEGELGVELLAEALGEGWAGSGGGDGDLQVSAADYGGEVEVAEGRVIDGVAEDVALGGFVGDGAVDCWVVGGGDYEKISGEVARGVLALMPFDFAGGGEVGDALRGLGGDDGNPGVRGLEGFDFGFGEVAGADDDAGACGDFEEDREEIHDCSVLMIAGGGPPYRKVCKVFKTIDLSLDQQACYFVKVSGFNQLRFLLAAKYSK